MSIAELASEYFSTLNPIAERISNDIEAVREAYEDLWQCLSNKEKEQIINETVIYPEAVLEYSLCIKNTEETKLNKDNLTGAKYIIDDQTGSTWRDEHSAPFSWKTPSQLNLHLFETTSPCKNVTMLLNKVNVDRNSCIDNYNIQQTIPLHSNDINNDKIDGWGRKLEKNLSRKILENPEPPNLVIGGTGSRISGLCSKLKFLPGKTCSYEVKTVVSQNTNVNEGNLINKIKTNTVLKIQNTIRLVGGKNFISNEKKNTTSDIGETENLVQQKTTVTVTKLQKPSPKVAKPKSPPPPPPKPKFINTNVKDEEIKMILVKQNSVEKIEHDTEKTNLLNEDVEEQPMNDEKEDCLSVEDEGPKGRAPIYRCSTESIPKSGFDFLDNW